MQRGWALGNAEEGSSPQGRSHPLEGRGEQGGVGQGAPSEGGGSEQDGRGCLSEHLPPPESHAPTGSTTG